jgi:hypothetical protein
MTVESGTTIQRPADVVSRWDWLAAKGALYSRERDGTPAKGPSMPTLIKLGFGELLAIIPSCLLMSSRSLVTASRLANKQPSSMIRWMWTPDNDPRVLSDETFVLRHQQRERQQIR